MTNVVKHAQARSLSLELKQSPGWVEIVVADDGIGFPDHAPNTPRSTGGFGLFQIRERLWAWGGELRITNRSEGGTCAIIRMPEPQSFPKTT
jgi:two-component system sensor histidine kinase DegS